MTQDSRLTKLEECLTAKQAVMVWLQQTKTHANAIDYAKSLVNRPEQLRPITAITERLSAATRYAMKGQPEKAVAEAVRRGNRDVVFLIKLHHQTNFYFMTEERVWIGAFAYLEAKLRAIVYFGLLREVVKPKGRVSHENVAWRQIAEAYLTEMYAFRQATKTISQNYFSGEVVFFSDYARGLDELIGGIETLLWGFNEDVVKKPREKMNLEMLRKNSYNATQQRISYLVDLAKSEALAATGEDQAAEELAVRHL